MESPPTILVVDDQATNLHLVADILRPRYEVVFATSGARALQLARTRNPSLVLLDVHLGDMHGYDVCRRLKADEATRATPVVFLTGSDDPAREAARREVGASETLLKPIDPTHLLARVAAYLS